MTIFFTLVTYMPRKYELLHDSWRGTPTQGAMAQHLTTDALSLVAALLDYEDIQALRSTCRILRLDATLRDARKSQLIIPPIDRERARKLLQGLLASDPQCMTRFAWIQVATTWHVDLLIEFGVGENVQIDTIRANDDEATAAICASLTRLATLRRLDVSRSSLQDGTVIAFMDQLRELRVRGRRLRDLSFLAPLPKLEVLYIDQTGAPHIRALENLVELKELHLQQGFALRTPLLVVPPLRRLTKLHTLNMWGCSIESTEDLYGIASSIKRLQISGVRPRPVSDIQEEEAWSTRSTSIQVSAEATELAQRLTQIESVEWGDILEIEGAISDKQLELTAPLMPTLKTIDSFITEGFAAFEKLQHLEKIMIKARRPEDIQVLLKLPRLREVELEIGLFVEEDDAESSEQVNTLVKAIQDVLVQVPQIKRLSIEGFVDEDQKPPIPKLSHLEHLRVAYMTPEAPEAMSYDWMTGFTSLRSLELQPSTTRTNAHVISQLKQLQHLVLHDVQVDCASHGGFDFLRPLVKLTELTLECDHIHDLRFLEDMVWLTELTIDAICAEAKPKNVDTLRRLTRLRVLDITKTNIYDVTCLLSLSQLRTVHISPQADCRPLVENDHPKLLGVLHAGRNCLWDAPHARSDGNARKRRRSY